MTQLATNQEFSMSPRNLNEAMEYAQLISNSDLAPKDFKGKPGNVLIAIQMGMEVGLKPMQAIQNIAVINGRPAIWGDAMLALVMNHPEFSDIDERLENGVATCTITRKNRTPTMGRFSEDDAKKAGLFGKQGPWTQYKDRMLKMRARSFALRDAFPDALRGLSVAEEVMDIPDKNYQVVTANIERKESAQNRLDKMLSNEVSPESAWKEEVDAASVRKEILDQETGELIANNDLPFVTDHDVKKMIEEAKTLEDLMAAKKMSRSLTEEEKSPLRILFKEKEELISG